MSEANNLIDAEADYLESLAVQLRDRSKGLRETNVRIAKETEQNKLVSELENLPFRPAKSGRCDWCPAVEVADEIRTLFDPKGNFRTEEFHYIQTKEDKNVLRFKRKAGVVRD